MLKCTPRCHTTYLNDTADLKLSCVGVLSRRSSFYHDCIVSVPHDRDAHFGLEFEVNSISLHLDPCVVVRQLDTGIRENVGFFNCHVQTSEERKKQLLSDASWILYSRLVVHSDQRLAEVEGQFTEGDHHVADGGVSVDLPPPHVH